MTFWCLSFFNSKCLLAPSEAGLISNTAPANSNSTVGGGDSPSYSGFFHCLAVFDDRSSLALTRAVYYCVCGLNNLSMGLLSRVASSPTRVTTCLPVHRRRNSLKLISCLSPQIFYTKHNQIPLYSIELITLCSISWIPFVYLLEHP